MGNRSTCCHSGSFRSMRACNVTKHVGDLSSRRPRNRHNSFVREKGLRGWINYAVQQPPLINVRLRSRYAVCEHVTAVVRRGCSAPLETIHFTILATARSASEGDKPRPDRLARTSTCRVQQRQIVTRVRALYKSAVENRRAVKRLRWQNGDPNWTIVVVHGTRRRRSERNINNLIESHVLVKCISYIETDTAGGGHVHIYRRTCVDLEMKNGGTKKFTSSM